MERRIVSSSCLALGDARGLCLGRFVEMEGVGVEDYDQAEGGEVCHNNGSSSERVHIVLRSTNPRTIVKTIDSDNS